MSKAHTQTKWKAGRTAFGTPAIFPEGSNKAVALFGIYKPGESTELENAKEHMETIVRAVNSHEAMKEALEYWLDIAQHDPKYAAWQGKARAALKLAKEGE